MKLSPHTSPSSRWARMALLALGSFFLLLGLAGVVVPVLPTTPFLILAAICYGRGSPRWYRWLVTNRVFGRYLDDYLQGKGVPWKVKAGTLVLLWTVISLSALLLIDTLWLRILLFAIAVGVTVHLVLLKSKRRAVSEREAESTGDGEPGLNASDGSEPGR
jgi:uncharacterized membrane protein YbaN (DUF454 family)